MLGVQPHQRTRGELQGLGCALAVFVPVAPAARLLGWYCGGVVRPRAVWCWVQAAGHHAMEHLQEALAAVARGHEPTQIGRASCRVSVLISVVVVSFKKK